MDWLREYVAPAAAVLGIFVAPVIAWVKHISGRVQRESDRNSALDTRLTVLEAQSQQVPALFRDIKHELTTIREDGRERDQKFYDHMDRVRLELKADLASKQDKA